MSQESENTNSTASLPNQDILDKIRKRNASKDRLGAQKSEIREKYLAFKLGQEWFGLEVKQVREINRLENITRVPLTPSHVTGITNLRGNITAVIDIRAVLGTESELLKDSARIIVTNSQGLEAGIIAEQVAEVVEVPLGAIEPPVVSLGHDRNKYTFGVVQLNNRPLVLLNLNSILADLKV